MVAESLSGSRDTAGDAARDGDAQPVLAATLRRLVDAGLGPIVGLGADRRRRSAIERVARLGAEELARRLDAVYRDNRAALVRHARAVLGNREDAEDVVNEAFIRVLRANPDLHTPESLVHYIGTAVRNEALDRGSRNTRDRTARVPVPVAGSGPEGPADVDAWLAAPDRPVEDRVCDELTLALAMNVLSDRQRQCFALRFVDGLSVQDTAARLAISDGNVKRICHEVRARLAAALAAPAA
jgi:RNA polymerase sigma-70 factor (ECF subfamily)